MFRTRDKKHICIVPSGRMTPGKATIIESIVLSAVNLFDMEVSGVDSFGDFLNRELYHLDERNVHAFMQSKEPHTFEQFYEKKWISEVAVAINRLKITAVIVIGGYGSLCAAKALMDMGINTVFIPATIENDIRYSEYCIGVDSALNMAMDLLEKLSAAIEDYPKHCLFVKVPGCAPFAGEFAKRLERALRMPKVLSVTGIIDKETLSKELDKLCGTFRAAPLIVPYAAIPENDETVSRISDMPSEFLACTYSHHDIRPFLHSHTTFAYDKIIAHTVGEYAVEQFAEGYKDFAVQIAKGRLNQVPLSEAAGIALRCNWPVSKL